MNVNEMTVKEFRALPNRGWDEEIEPFRSMIILPAQVDYVGAIKYWARGIISKLFSFDPPGIWEIGHMHDSGYRCMDFVAVNENSKPICRLSGCSDVIHIDGIGGYGERGTWGKGIPDTVPVSSWSIDCLAKSGLLRMFCRGKIKVGVALSSFDIYCVKEKE